MKIFKALFISTVSIVGLAGITSPANAGYNCTHHEFLGTTCSGTVNGQSVRTNTTYSDVYGSRTTGTVGGEQVDIRCNTNFLGTTCN